MRQWIKKELGTDVPLHFSAFHPDYKMPDIPATPPATLIRARNIAILQGLHYGYTGNAALIERDWYQIIQYRLTQDAKCPDCGAAVDGHFSDQAGAFGRRRIPVAINRSIAR